MNRRSRLYGIDRVRAPHAGYGEAGAEQALDQRRAPHAVLFGVVAAIQARGGQV